MADTIRAASATWHGELKTGNGKVSTDSGTLQDTSYSFPSRFESGKGTNPEELLAAAHAGCYSMALAAGLSRKGHTVHHISTKAHVYLSPKPEGGFKISKIVLDTRGKVEDMDADAFKSAAETTAKTCIVSEALSAVPTEVHAELE